MKHYEDLIERLRNGTKLPLLQALMNEAADAIEALVGAEKRKTGKDAPLTDYISREAALESVREKVLICESLPDTIAKDASLFTLASMNDSLNSIPAADARPVVRGKWVRASRRNIHCSVCGELALGVRWWEGDLEESNFCPNCGADMGRKADV